MLCCECSCPENLEFCIESIESVISDDNEGRVLCRSEFWDFAKRNSYKLNQLILQTLSYNKYLNTHCYITYAKRIFTKSKMKFHNYEDKYYSDYITEIIELIHNVWGEPELSSIQYYIRENIKNKKAKEIERKFNNPPLSEEEKNKRIDILLEKLLTISQESTTNHGKKNNRRGQSELRELLILKDCKCKICGIKYNWLLVTSHIKDWHSSSNEERLNEFNVLLLCEHHDSAFNDGYITFDDEGNIVISEIVLCDKELIDYYRLNKDIKIDICPKNLPFLEYHRENIFIDNIKQEY